MPYAVEMYVDARTDQVVRRLWADLKNAGIPNELEQAQARPHISLACYEHIQPERLVDRLAAFAEDLSVLSLTFSFIGVFPKGIVFWGINANTRLLQVHSRYQAAFTEFDGVSFALYHPGIWVPHCTLAMGLNQDEITRSVALAQRCALPIEAQLEKLALVEFAPTREWAVFDLVPQPERSTVVRGESE